MCTLLLVITNSNVIGKIKNKFINYITNYQYYFIIKRLRYYRETY